MLVWLFFIKILLDMFGPSTLWITSIKYLYRYVENDSRIMTSTEHYIPVSQHPKSLPPKEKGKVKIFIKNLYKKRESIKDTTQQ